MAQLLLDHGADPEHVNEDGITPALTALEEGWEDVAQLLAAITKENLNIEQDQEVDPLAHIEQEDRQVTQQTQSTEQEEEEDELSDELSSKMQEIMRRIEEQGGVENEEELREMVTKMVLDEMQRKINEE